MIRTLAIAALATAGLSAAANAAPITGYIYLNQPAIAANATIANRPATPADATFTLNGTTNFIGTGDSTTGTIGQFIGAAATATLSAPAVAAAILNQTYFFFEGTIVLAAGPNAFVVTHDDGLQLDILGIPGFEVDEPGPTAPVATNYIVNAPAAGLYNFVLSYGETAGGPAQLTVFGGSLTEDVPEPGSLAVLGLGFGLAALGLRRRAR